MAWCSCSIFLWLLTTIFALATTFKLWMKLTTGWANSKTCLSGKTAVVTGANTGIGYETALDFAMRGARVILACRDRSKAEEARDKIIRETGNDNVVVRVLDLASFKSVREFAKDFNKTEERLDVLVNNAGAAGIGDGKSEDGHVLLMQINYLSSFLLTHLLIDLLKKSGCSRIVNVSSMAASLAKTFKVDGLDSFQGNFEVYNNSKLCNILFTRELARRLRAEGTGVTAYSLHPGAVKTDIFRHVKGITKYFVNAAVLPMFKTVQEGAQTTIYTAVEKGIECFTGEHFQDCKKIEPYKTVKVLGIEQKLWTTTEEIIKMKPEEIRI